MKLIGGRKPLRLAQADFDAKLARPAEREVLERIGIPTFDALLHTFLADADGLRKHVGPGPVLSDDRPLVEYFLSLRGEAEVAAPPLSGDRERLLQR